ncbi:uncharacterized protein LOC141679290 [Apium graveolens]|uniref:uncharacterized protein LOC141679290 n=1 Tax=Apium graveolens TaxID=4045 RepID=UPI003D78F34B
MLRAVPSRFLQITSIIEQYGNLDMMTVEEAVGSLNAHEERVKGKVETSEGKLMLTEEEWKKRKLVKFDKSKKELLQLDERVMKLKLAKNIDSNQVESNLRYLDNGASNHMTGQKSKFKILDEQITSQVKFGDGSTMEIKGRGSISMKCKDGQERVLNEVYFIPSLRSNIISIGQLIEEGSKVVIRGEYIWIFDKNEGFS